MENSTVTIKRKWNNAEIIMTINQKILKDDDTIIKLEVSLNDFLKILKDEIGPVTWIFTDPTFQERFDSAVSMVVEGIKENASYVAAYQPIDIIEGGRNEKV